MLLLLEEMVASTGTLTVTHLVECFNST